MARTIILAVLNNERTIKEEAIERVLLGSAVALLFFIGYFAIGFAGVHRKVHDFDTSFDRRIPFIAGSIWIYLWSYTASAIPVFIVRCYRLFRRTLFAYAISIGISLIFFTTLPVTAQQLRARGATLLGIKDLSHWAVSAVYALDPPYNLFPSLHVCLTALAAMAAWKANRACGALLFAGLGLVAIAVCTVKQHFLVDSVAGLTLAALVGALLILPYRHEGAKVAYSWRGPIGYLGCLAAMYVGFYAAYFRASHG